MSRPRGWRHGIASLINPCGDMDEGEIPYSSPCPSLPVARARPGLQVMRTGELSPPVTCRSTWESSPTPHLGSRSRAYPDGSGVREPVPGVVSLGELTLLPVCKERCPPQPLPIDSTVKRTGPGVTETGELSPFPLSCNTWESRPYSLPGQHSRTGSGCGGCR